MADMCTKFGTYECASVLTDRDLVSFLETAVGPYNMGIEESHTTSLAIRFALFLTLQVPCQCFRVLHSCLLTSYPLTSYPFRPMRMKLIV